MPYNYETETFYQAPATVVDSTPDGDTVQEGFDDRLTPAMAGLYADLNLLKADGMISVGIPATTTARGIGRVATSADLVDGATITNGPAFLAAGVHTSVAPAAGIIPLADGNKHLALGWFGSMLCNARTIITFSGNYTAPLTGWYRICCIGGGGGGGGGCSFSQSKGGLGGNAGGNTSFGAISANGGGGGGGALTSSTNISGGGGGGAGCISTGYLHLTKDQVISVIIGAGGSGGTASTTTAGSNGGGTYGGLAALSTSTTGPSGGTGGGPGGFGGTGIASGGGPGGSGGSNGTAYGGGGGGGGSCSTSNALGGTRGSINATNGATSTQSGAAGNGGNGGNGAVIIEYFDPSVTN